MSLKNLTGISLETIEANAASIQKLLAAAERNIADSHIDLISSETRFDASYKAIMQLANAALQANGYRTLTSKPGHHMTLIQTLPQTAGVNQSTVIILDALRKQRNVTDYSGDTVSISAAEDCLAQAENLLVGVQRWLALNKPHLLK